MLSASAPPDSSGVLAGSMILRGGGDPTWHDSWHPGQSLEPLLAALRHAGVKRIQGEVLLVGGEADGLPAGGWAWNDLAWGYGATPSALAVDRNATVLRLRPGAREGDPVLAQWDPSPPVFPVELSVVTGEPESQPVWQIKRSPEGWMRRMEGRLPAASETDVTRLAAGSVRDWFRIRLSRTFVQEGLLEDPESVRWVETPEAPGAWSIPVWSPPLVEILGHMLRQSDNWEARMIELALGAGEPDLPGWFVHDGAGLSRGNLASARALVSLIGQVEPLKQLMPVAGREGTLEDRFQDSSAEGVLRAKTGSMRFVQGLAGVVATEDGRDLLFAILLNHDRPAAQGGEVTGQAWVDRCVRALSDHAASSRPFAGNGK